MSMQPYQQRVVDECNQLADRLDALRVFTHSPEFKQLDGAECRRLTRQADYMDMYLDILRQRIAAF